MQNIQVCKWKLVKIADLQLTHHSPKDSRPSSLRIGHGSAQHQLQLKNIKSHKTKKLC